MVQDLQWPTNRKSYMVYRTAQFSMILNITMAETSARLCYKSQRWKLLSKL